jgi:hypothetical protein
MKIPWYLRQGASVALVAGLGGLFTVVSGALAQPWAVTPAPNFPGAPDFAYGEFYGGFYGVCPPFRKKDLSQRVSI